MVGIEMVVGLKGDFLDVICECFVRVCRRGRCCRLLCAMFSRASLFSFLSSLFFHVFEIFVDPFLS